MKWGTDFLMRFIVFDTLTSVDIHRFLASGSTLRCRVQDERPTTEWSKMALSGKPRRTERSLRSSRLGRTVFVAAATVTLLGLHMTPALAYSHTLGGVYHGVHGEGSGSSRRHYAWSDHNHGTRYIQLVGCNYLGQCVYPKGSITGSSSRVHIQLYFSGTGGATQEASEPSGWCGYSDGHGFCLHTEME
ncbi:hypothetical protein ACIBQ6_15100 [Nonomuraea sp. NPDC049655]|uniref:hypothetical protein n=1 Tax=Nonomuraea sp. NPDC049655 TaxID=3364355 RepID=UPI0037A3FF09